MKTGLPLSANCSTPPSSALLKDLFRARFQSALRSCVRRRFSVAECFGVIWLETLEQVALPDQEQSELYEELIHWAKFQLFPELIQSYSPSRFAKGPGLDTPELASASPSDHRVAQDPVYSR